MKLLIVFGLFWSAITLTLDCFILVNATRQVRAMSFPATEGMVLSSEVSRHSGGKGGSTYGVKMSYTYTVNGQEHEGKRYRYDTTSSSDSAWARKAVKANPKGAKVKVYYNPDDPADAVLSPGIEGSDLFLLLFLTPFNGVMLAIWLTGLTRLRHAWFKPVAGGVKITAHLRQTKARLVETSSLMAGGVTIGLLAFLAIFVVAFLLGGFHPSLKTMLITWAVILAAGIGVSVHQSIRIWKGKYDLLIDDMNSFLELPATCGRKARIRVPFSQIQGIAVEKTHQASKNTKSSSPQFAPTLQLGGTPPHTERLAAWYSQEQAEAFARWLGEKLRLDAKNSWPIRQA